VASARGWPELYNVPFTRPGRAALVALSDVGRALTEIRRAASASRRLNPRASAPFSRRNTMPKSKKASQTTESAQDMQKVYAHAYARRLEKEVAGDVDSSGAKATGRKKRDGKN
jgi:hypothetical protein